MVNDMQRYMVLNKNLELDQSDKRHIIQVMKMKIGEEFEIVFDKQVFLCSITSISKKNLTYQIVSKYDIDNLKKYKVVLGVCLIKEQKMDYLLQKACELGVDEIIPIISDRTVIKIDNKKDNKITRWNRILKESSEQSFRSSIPIIHEIIRLKDIVKYDYSLKMVCSTKEKDNFIKKVLQDNKKSDTMLIVAGPEGGFSLEEENYLIDNGFIPTTLGSNILRAETVPLYVLSVINYEYGGEL